MLKRTFDIVVSLLALAILWPVILVAAILVRTKLGAPVLFVQERPGLNGEMFRLIKFRTMLDAPADAELGSAEDEARRMTRFGQALRSTSIDELPELLNVLRGDMSLVGPRPLLKQYLPLYSDTQKRRHEVRPGITGYAQVNGRNNLDWNERFELDVWYVDNQSLWLDLNIILKTISAVVFRKDISQEGRATMDAFTGNDSEKS